MKKDTKVFNGERYTVYTHRISKVDAVEDKKELMRKGWKVRIVERKEWKSGLRLYLVYRRKKK